MCGSGDDDGVDARISPNSACGVIGRNRRRPPFQMVLGHQLDGWTQSDEEIRGTEEARDGAIKGNRERETERRGTETARDGEIRGTEEARKGEIRGTEKARDG